PDARTRADTRRGTRPLARHSVTTSQTPRTSNTTTTTRAASGYSTASNTNPTTRPSSNSDNPMLLNGSGETFTAALVVALVEWAARAVTPEEPAPSIGDRATSPASRHPTHPAATGRITVWTASQMSSRYGTFSTKNS